MGNWLLSIFNFGNSTQVENTIIHSKVDTLNDLIKEPLANSTIIN